MAETGKNDQNPEEWLMEFRVFQQRWHLDQDRMRDDPEGARKALAEFAQAQRDHWAGVTPPALMPILRQAYTAQRERERRAIEQTREGREVLDHPGRYEGSHADEWSPADRARYRAAEVARKAREQAREQGDDRGRGD